MSSFTKPVVSFCRRVLSGTGLLLILPLTAHASGGKSGSAPRCEMQPLLHQHRDAATIQRLERAWSLAYLRGDTDLEDCLLTPDFTEIMRTGEVKVLKDELEFAERNKGKNLKAPDAPDGTVLLHGDVAVAYGTSKSTAPDGAVREVRYADYYVWHDGKWRAFFAQQSQVPPAKS